MKSRGAHTSSLVFTVISVGALTSSCDRDFSFLDDKMDARVLDTSDRREPASQDTSAPSLRDAESKDASIEAQRPIEASEGASRDAPEAGNPTFLVHRIALRGNHLCVIDPSDRGVLCRGENQGIDPDNDGSVREWHPVLVSPTGPNLTNVNALAAGQYFTCAVTDDGVYCWGIEPGTFAYTSYARRVITGLSNQYNRIEAGEGHVCISDPVYCWGDNSYGQIMDPGEGDAGRIREPTRMFELSPRNLLALGFRHTCAQDGDRTLCWGLDDFRQCGNKPNHLCLGDAPCATQPIEVSGVSGAIGFGLGTIHSCAIKEDRTVACWGESDAGQSGVVAPTGCANDECVVDVTDVNPQHVHDVTRLALGSTHSCALTAAGFVYCWGNNSVGQMGDYATGGIGADPLQVLDDFGNPLHDVVDIVASGTFTCALTSSGHLSCWGLWMNDPILPWAKEIPY